MEPHSPFRELSLYQALALSWLRASGALALAELLVPGGAVRTANVMLVAPGAERQPVHADFGEAGGYVTVLVALTPTRREAGGTRLWPG